MIKSKDSPKAAFFFRIRNNKRRRSGDLFMIEGVHPVEEAMKAGSLERVIYSSRLNDAHKGRELLRSLISSGVVADEAPERLLKELSSVENDQGILAAARPRNIDFGDLFKTTDPFLVIACGIQDPGNLGTIIRTADAAGCSGLIFTSGTVDPYNEKVVRSTAGSIFHLNIVKYDDIIDLINALKRRGVKVVAARADAEDLYFSSDLRGPLALLIGNEGRGLPENALSSSDLAVSIPMSGGAESLNAAVSAALLMYESVRQRMNNAG